MPEIPLPALRTIASHLDSLGLDYAFVGGSIIGLLVDNPTLSPVRSTDDFDVILEVVAQTDYARIEEKLRQLGFDHDMREGAPRCRWMLGNLTVDIMPADADFLGLRTAWFREALTSAKMITISNTQLRVISPAGFVATKYTAFQDRGEADFYASHDLEDLIAVIDGRAGIVQDILESEPALRRFIVNSITGLLASEDFLEALPGHLPADIASQRRLPGLLQKLKRISEIQP